MAESAVGRQELDRFVYDQLSAFSPGEAHLSLVQIPWNSVFTTNFDLLVEMASESDKVIPAGNFTPIVSFTEDLGQLTDNDIPYYKVHGSIDRASTPAGRLLLTNDDYRNYHSHRQPLFGRLKLAFSTAACVFVGYSLQDDHILDLIDEVKQENDVLSLPLSYWVTPNFSKTQEQYWRSTYNIQLVEATAVLFFEMLAAAWKASEKVVLTAEQLEGIVRVEVDPSARFEKVGNSFLRVSATGCVGPSDPSSFFRGAPPIWADIRDGVAPLRTAFYSLMEPISNEFTNSTAGPSVYLLTGAAGTGKTTLVMQLLYEFCHDSSAETLWHISGTPLEVGALTPLVNMDRSTRLLLVVEHASEQIVALNYFWDEVRKYNLPISLILVDRGNQWTFATRRRVSDLRPEEVQLATLDQEEITQILAALEKHDCLGRLAGATKMERLNHFQSVASRELLVALRELTEETSFDEYVIDEFNRIPESLAREAYGYVAALGQYDLFIRYQLLTTILRINNADIQQKVFSPTKGVLFDAEDVGFSRHNFGYRIRARHPIIASAVFHHVADTDEKKYQLFMNMVSMCDPGYPEDKQFLIELARERRLTEVIADPEWRRGIFQELERKLPDDGYVLQHRSILERTLDNPNSAVDYARRALVLEPRNLHFENTLGLALVRLAEQDINSPRSQVHAAEAKRLFERGMRENPGNAYSYLGLSNVMRYEILRELNENIRHELEVKHLEMLEAGVEATAEDSILAERLAIQLSRFGDRPAAIDVLSASLKTYPSDSKIRALLGSYLIESSRSEEAVDILSEGVLLDPNSWQIRRQIARALTLKDENPLVTSGHYSYAVRYNPRDYYLIVEAAAFEFLAGRYVEANLHFEKAKNLRTLSAREKRRLVTPWGYKHGKAALTYKGRVDRPRGSIGFVRAEPGGFVAQYFTGGELFQHLRYGDRIEFQIKFNAYGAQCQLV